MSKIRVRIAPSPTGEDLHIGNVYTALLNYVFVRKKGGKFVLRIEDTDRTRLVLGAEGRIINSLKWLGLNYDEGPDIGGPYTPYRQSERLDLYRQYAQKLVAENHAYYCFCTPERLEEMRKKQQEQKRPTLYDGLCKNINKNDAEKRAKKEKYVIRLNVPEEGITEFNDVIRGKISFENRFIDDQVLIKSDGYPTYHLAVVVDDYLMKISHVIRAEEWISSTPKHILLYKFLGWLPPVFAHGPILRNPDKSKLSKRKNPVWISWYRKQGFLPEALLNYLALMGWSMPDEREIFSIEEMVKYFRLEDIKPVGPAFDIKKLEWMNGEYIRKSQNADLKLKILNFYEGKLDEKLVNKTIPLIRERIKKLSDYLPLCEFFFKEPKEYDLDLSNKKDLIKKIYGELKKIVDWKADLIGETMQSLCKDLGLKSADFFMFLRIAITGKKISPPLNDAMEILGKKEVLTRLERVFS